MPPAQNGKTMNILIADDHAVVRRGLKEILADALPGARFKEAGTGEETLSCLAECAAGLLVLDINMPGRSGLDVLREVKNAYPRLPVIVLSMQPEDQYALRCLRAGAAAYINKDSAPEELAQAAKKILGGGRYVSPRFAEKLVAQLDEPTGKPPHESLSDREHEVMRMIASGMPLTEIAERLHVSVKTVSTYRSRIMEKMQMKSNADLARYAMKQQLID
jgi:two-component system invasion response regulator UvrY